MKELIGAFKEFGWWFIVFTFAIGGLILLLGELEDFSMSHFIAIKISGLVLLYFAMRIGKKHIET